MILAYLGSAALIYLILKQRQPRWAVAGTIAFAWNPLVLLAVAQNGHNDIVMIFFLLAAVWALVHRTLAQRCAVRSDCALSAAGLPVSGDVDPDEVHHDRGGAVLPAGADESRPTLARSLRAADRFGPADRRVGHDRDAAVVAGVADVGAGARRGLGGPIDPGVDHLERERHRRNGDRVSGDRASSCGPSSR